MKMKTKTRGSCRRAGALLLSLVMMLGLMATTAFATSGDGAGDDAEAGKAEIFLKQAMAGSEEGLNAATFGETDITVKNGEFVGYEIEIKNGTGEAMKNITASVAIPNGLKYEPAETAMGKLSEDGKRIEFEVLELADGASVTMGAALSVENLMYSAELTVQAHLTYEGAAQTVASNAVKLIGGEAPVEGDGDENQAEAALTVELTQGKGNGGSGSVAAKVDDLTGIVKDDELTYYVKVSNTGEKAVANLVVAIELPEGLAKTGLTMSDNGTLDNGKVAWTATKLDAGKSLEFFVVTKAEDLKENDTVEVKAAVSYVPEGAEKAESLTSNVAKLTAGKAVEDGEGDTADGTRPEGVASGDIYHTVEVVATKSQVMDAVEKGEFTSTVVMQKLEADKDYVLTGTLFDTATNKAIQSGEKDITVEAKFKATGETMTQAVKFEINAVEMAGKTIGVNYVVKDAEDNTVLTLKNDKSAKAIVYVPKITVKFTDNTGVNSSVGLNTATKFKATVSYTNLMPDVEYQLLVSVMDATEKAAIKGADGKEISVTSKFTPKATSGSEEIEFTLDTTKLENHKLAVTAVLYDGSNHKLAVEDDYTGENASLVGVKAMATAYTGLEDYATRVLFFCGAMLCVAGACVFGAWRKNKMTSR